MPPLNILVKPTSGDCNYRCTYCFFYWSHLSPHQRRMSYATLERLVEQYLSYSERVCNFAWQGGEPTMMGLDFFREAVRLQKEMRRPGQRVTNSLQTNGSLLDDEWCEFLRENRFLVGLSLDGPEEIHDRYRINAGKKGTWKQVMRAAELLRAHRVEVNILTVVTSSSARKGRQIYRFLREQKFDYLQFIPCLDMNENGELADWAVQPEDYGLFLRTVFDEWYRDVRAGNGCSIRYFDNILQMMLGFPPETCQLAGNCAGQCVIEYDGSVYPCDFFVEERWRLGNIMEQPLAQILRGEKLKEYFRWAHHLPEKCRSCRWLRLCNGGCARQRAIPGGDTTRVDFLCEAYKSFLGHAHPRLSELARAMARMTAAG